MVLLRLTDDGSVHLVGMAGSDKMLDAQHLALDTDPPDLIASRRQRGRRPGLALFPGNLLGRLAVLCVALVEGGQPIGGLGGANPRAAIVFDCAGRRRALREGIPQEVEAIAGALGDPAIPLVGLYTHGEVARLRGAKGDRNHAVVTVAFA